MVGILHRGICPPCEGRFCWLSLHAHKVGTLARWQAAWLSRSRPGGVVASQVVISARRAGWARNGEGLPSVRRITLASESELAFWSPGGPAGQSGAIGTQPRLDEWPVVGVLVDVVDARGTRATTQSNHSEVRGSLGLC